MFFNIHIYSKNYNSIKNFVGFLDSKFKTLEFNKINKTTTTSVVTVLKSPHVNKTAQEHFSFSCFTKNLTIKANNPLVLLLIIKTIKQKLFLDIKFKIKILNKNRSTNKLAKNQIHPNNFNMSNTKDFLNNYIFILNSYGKFVVL